MHHRLSARRAAVVSLALLLSACESGSEKGSAHTAVSTNSISFSAASPDAATPAVQVVDATFGDAVVHLAVVHTGDAIAEVTSSIGERTAQIAIAPRSPGSVGSGTFGGTVAVTGYSCADARCSALAPGNTQTIVVTYQISPIVRYVAPYVGVTDTSATAIVRGAGFQRFSIEGVTFGTAAATSFTVVGDGEIQVTYPALPAGSYPVQISVPAHEGTVTSTATLTVVEPSAHAAATLAYPTANPGIRALVHDAERDALLVASDAGGGSVLRYSHVAGTWGAPLGVPLDALQDISLSTDGAQLLALSRTQLTPVDPASLAAGVPVDPPALVENTFLKNLSVANDNRAVITSGIDESTITPVYLYTVRAGTLTEAAAGFALNNATPRASSNGARMVLMQGHPTQETEPAVFTYTASSGSFGGTGIGLKQNEIPPALDRTGTRIVLNGVRVYDAAFAFLGVLPETTLAVALSPDGTRAYTYDSAAAAVLTFDITEAVTEEGNALPQVGTPTALAGDPGAGVRMAISLDGNTLFLAGSTQLVIQPTP